MNSYFYSRLLIGALSIRSASSAIGDLLWSDEFTGSSLNTDVWNVRTGAGGWGNFELQEYTADALSIQNNDALEIRVTRTGDSTFSSGRLDTAKTVEFLYGRVEARIQTPNVVEGLWPAFWTLGSSFSDGTPWPACGEIDIMEVGQGLALAEGLGNNRVVSAAHWELQEAYASYAGKRDVNFNLNDGYSTFVLDWTPQALITYVNGAEIWRMDINSTSCEDCEEFHKPHFIVLNVAVGGGFTSGSESSSSASSSSSSSSAGCGSSSAYGGEGCGSLRTPTDITAPLPGAMLVDWVRIFDNGGATLTSGSSFNIVTQAPSTAATLFPTPGLQTDGLPPPPVTLSYSTRRPTQADPLLPPPPTSTYNPPPTRSPVVYSYNAPTASGSVATPHPSARIASDAVYADSDDDDDDDDGCSGKGKSGKGKSGKGDSGKGKGGKGKSERRLKKSEKCGKGKGKKGVRSDEFETGLFVSSATSHSLVAAAVAALLAIVAI